MKKKKKTAKALKRTAAAPVSWTAEARKPAWRWARKTIKKQKRGKNNQEKLKYRMRKIKITK